MVLGGGLAGLCTGALLARAGISVLVVEAQSEIGGYARLEMSFVGQTADGQFPDLLLRHLGVRDRVRFLPLDPFYRAVLPTSTVDASTGLEAFIDAYQQAFPAEAAGLEKFFRLCATVQEEAHQLPPQLDLAALSSAVERYPTLFGLRNSTLAGVLNVMVGDRAASAAASAIWTYLGCPPSRLSFVVMAQMLMCHVDHPAGVEGGFRQLALALADAGRAHGAEILTGSTATSVVLEHGKAHGVELEGGLRVGADAVVSAIDALTTFDRLVGASNLPSTFVRRLHERPLSISAYVAELRVDPRVLQGSSVVDTICLSDPDGDAIYRDHLAGMPRAVQVTVAEQMTGRLVVKVMAPYDMPSGWPAALPEFRRRALQVAELGFSGISSSATVIAEWTPVDLQQMTGNSRGATVGWDQGPRWVASRALSYRTPIRGLYLGGHWTQAGMGALRCMVSAAQLCEVMRATGGLPRGTPLLETDLIPSQVRSGGLTSAG